jgi:imidazolonepropionase-like amidohydrolase
MKSLLSLAAALLLAALGALPARAADPAAPALVVLHAAHLFDAVSGKVTSPGVVVVEGRKIIAVGAEAKLPAGARVIDLGDATLLPGFIDAHLHLSDEMSPNWYRDFYDGILRFPAEKALRASRNARVTLEAGVTTVRDLGSNDYVALGLRNAINDGVIPGPRMLVSNYAIGSTAGHADQDPYPPALIPPAGPIKGVCNGPEECRAAVRYQIKYGADVIKFMPSGGVLSLTDPIDNVQLDQAEMDAIVTEAHRWGRKVAAHCHGDRAAIMAIAAGVDSIEHGTFLEDSTLAEMKRKGVYLVPTLSTMYFIGGRADSFPPVIADKVRAASARLDQMIQHAIRIGTPIAMGTDAAVGPHGRNGVEFVLLVKGGMTPSQALLAGTARGAELLGVSDRVGTLVPGKLADIIALPGNPLDDIHAAEHPAFVMKEGQVFVGPR